MDKYQELLQQRISEVLHYFWDPIGVKGVPEARDEYDSYIGPILQILSNGGTSQEVAQLLAQVEKNQMQLEADLQQNLDIADLILHWQAVLRRDR